MVFTLQFEQGSDFDRGATLADYRIMLEQTECPAVDLLSNLVSCEPPKKEHHVDMTDAYEHDVIRIQVKRTRV